jgi:hypothetical protein
MVKMKESEMPTLVEALIEATRRREIFWEQENSTRIAVSFSFSDGKVLFLDTDRSVPNTRNIQTYLHSSEDRGISSLDFLRVQSSELHDRLCDGVGGRGHPSEKGEPFPVNSPWEGLSALATALGGSSKATETIVEFDENWEW